MFGHLYYLLFLLRFFVLFIFIISSLTRVLILWQVFSFNSAVATLQALVPGEMRLGMQLWLLIPVAVMLFFVLYKFYKWRIKKLEKLFLLRNSISQDLYSEIGATLSSINIYSEIANGRITGDKEVNSLLERIRQGSQQALENINDIVWYADARNDSFENIAEKMRDFAQPLLEAKGIAVSFTVSEEVTGVAVTTQVRQNTYRIFKEAIHNIVRHSQARSATIKLSRTGNHILLQIEDDGTGFNPSQVKKGSGFNSMIYRAEEIKGVFRMDAAGGKGCRIEIFCPIT